MKDDKSISIHINIINLKLCVFICPLRLQDLTSEQIWTNFGIEILLTLEKDVNRCMRGRSRRLKLVVK